MPRKLGIIDRKGPELEKDFKYIDKNLETKPKEIRKPKDLTQKLKEIKEKFNQLISPFISGEYKKESHLAFVYDNANKTVKLRYQLMSLSEHLKDFVFQLRMQVISQMDDKDKIEEIEKEIKEWEKIINNVLNDFIETVNFVIQNYFVPICESLEKKKEKVKT